MSLGATPDARERSALGAPSKTNVARRTRLLVSVRDVDEARMALAAEVDLIDVKEPAHGSLGAASNDTVAAIASVVGRRCALSAALGELAAWDDGIATTLHADLSFVKLGLAGMADEPAWPRRWQAALTSVTAGPAHVAVAYADWQAALAPAPEAVIRRGADFGCRAVLVDTWKKDGRSLVDHWTNGELRDFVAAARAANLMVVLAGSLTVEAIAHVADLEPDYIAVRGAVCAGSREGRIDPRRLDELVRLVRRL